MSKSKREMIHFIWSFTIGDGHLSTLNPVLNSDGSVKCKRNNSKYSLKQLQTHKDYIEYQADIFSNLTKVSVFLGKPYTCKQGYTRLPQYNLNTLVHPLYTLMRGRCYQDGKKVILPHDLKNLSVLSLAHLFMDDGFTEIQPRKRCDDYVRIGIATHAFTYGDNLLLKKCIAEKFSIHFNVNVHRQSKNNGVYYYLRCSKDQANRFLDLIAPYVLPSYEYKLARLAPNVNN